MKNHWKSKTFCLSPAHYFRSIVNDSKWKYIQTGWQTKCKYLERIQMQIYGTLVSIVTNFPLFSLWLKHCDRLRLVVARWNRSVACKRSYSECKTPFVPFLLCSTADHLCANRFCFVCFMYHVLTHVWWHFDCSQIPKIDEFHMAEVHI